MLFFFFRKGPGDERGVQTPALAPARARAGAWDCDGHDGRDTRKDKGEAKSTGQLRQARRAAHGTASPRALAGLGQTANSFPCESGCPVRDCARGAPHFFPRRLSGDKDPQPGCRRGGGDAWRLYGHHASFFFLSPSDSKDAPARSHRMHTAWVRKVSTSALLRGRDTPHPRPTANHMRSSQGTQRPPGSACPCACAAAWWLRAPGCGAARDTDVRATCIRAGAS